MVTAERTTCIACHMPTTRHSYLAADGERYCSEWCYRTRTPEAASELRDAEIPVLWSEMMRGGCANCPRPQKNICYVTEKPATLTSIARFTAILTMPWDGKSADLIGMGISDGSVTLDQAGQLAARCEAFARAKGHSAVTLGDVAQAYAESTPSFAYRPAGDSDPGYEAALAAIESPVRLMADAKQKNRAKQAVTRSDPAARARQLQFMRESLGNQDTVHGLLANREMVWCSHAPHFLARLLAEPRLTRHDGEDIAEAAERVALERHHPGVLPADLQIALLRAAVNGSEPSACCTAASPS